MKPSKAKALGVAAIGLTGFLFALAAGITKLYAPSWAVDDNLLTWFFLIGMVCGAFFIAIGMVHYDRICQQELQDQAYKRHHFRRRVHA